MSKMIQIFGEPKFIIYKAENGWALYVPKDETVVEEYGSMVNNMLRKFGMTDPALEKAKAKQIDPCAKINGLFLFEKFEEMIGFIKIEFESFIESSAKIENA